MRTLGTACLGLALLALLASRTQAQPSPTPPHHPPHGIHHGDLLANASVQEELKLTDDQKAKVKEFAHKLHTEREAAFKKLEGLKGDELHKAVHELFKQHHEEVAKFAADTLKPDQVKRYKEIRRQVHGVFAFHDPEVQEALKLSDSQKAQIKTISEDTAKEIHTLLHEAGHDQAKHHEAEVKAHELRKESLQKALAVLNDSQKKEWQELTGAPFHLKHEHHKAPGATSGGTDK